MKYILTFALFLIIFGCNTDQEQDNKNINEVINALEEIHPSNLSPDKSWMIDLDTIHGILKSYTITYQGGEELKISLDSNLSIINPPTKIEYSWILDKELGDGFKISSIGFTKQGEVSLVIFNDGVGIYTEHNFDGIK